MHSYLTGNLMTEYRISDKFTLKANISNITYRLYHHALYTGHYIPGAGRTAQVTLNVKF